jgi:hypothetical protein
LISLTPPLELALSVANTPSGRLRSPTMLLMANSFVSSANTGLPLSAISK